MTDYTKTTNFTAKDSLPVGDAQKKVKGSEFDVEFNAIATAVGTKANLASPTFTGTPSAPTATAGTNTTQIATTAFVIANGVPVGGIIMWSGSIASIPSGFALCDGTNSTPDLRNSFVIGAGDTYSVDATGGSADATLVSHSHTINEASLDGTVSAISETFNGSGSATGVFTKSTGSPGGSTPGGTTDTSNAGSFTLDGAHTHTSSTEGSSATGANLPPYYALAYIMKTA